jgi:hypothetical protein
VNAPAETFASELAALADAARGYESTCTGEEFFVSHRAVLAFVARLARPTSDRRARVIRAWAEVVRAEFAARRRLEIRPGYPGFDGPVAGRQLADVDLDDMAKAYLAALPYVAAFAAARSAVDYRRARRRTAAALCRRGHGAVEQLAELHAIDALLAAEDRLGLDDLRPAKSP